MFEGFKEFWPFFTGGAAAIGGLWGHKLGQARNSWRIDALEKRQAAHEDDTKEKFGAAHSELAALRADAAEAKVNFGVLQVTLTQMRDALIRIEDRLDGKQDK